MKPIRILGAGPSGLTAAITLAKAGYNTEVYERGKHPGARFKGDLEALENWTTEEDVLDYFRRINIDINFDADPFYGMKIANGSRTWDIKTQKPAFYLVKRGSVEGSLDRGLEKQALNLGVSLSLNKTLPEDSVDIVATGPNPSNGIFGIDKGIIFKTDAKDSAIGIVNPEIAHTGYSYLLITNGYGCLATSITGNFNRIGEYFDKSRNLLLKSLDVSIRDVKRVGGIGSFSLEGRFKKEDRLYVGEAAGLQDFLWGFGIRKAVTSGHLAAKSIVDGTDYEQIAKEQFDRQLKAGVVNRFIWEKDSQFGFSHIVGAIAGSRDQLKFLRSFYNFNLLQRMVFPLALRHYKKKYPHLN